MRLAYLHPDDIAYAIDQVQTLYADLLNSDLYRAKLIQFQEYFNLQWLRRYIINWWNIYDITSDDHATNNDLEGWHRRLNEDLTISSRSLSFGNLFKN
jgi:hypothetical protein